MTLTTVNPALLDTQAQYTGFKNRIINGAMVIDQRNAGASVTITNTSTATYTLDRWQAYGSAASKFSVQQNAAAVTPPAGFKNYLGVTSLAATSIGSGDQYYVGQYIEGYNVADMGFGAAGASTFTISFWARSSLTGTFGGSVANSAFNRSYPFTYTISAANTWEQKTVTIAGDTTGTWLVTNGTGLQVNFGLGVGATISGTANAWAAAAYVSATGATSVVGTSGATFYITGVQLEKGSTATAFDYRPYGTELALCQRYYQTSYFGSAVGSITTTGQLLYTCCATFGYNGPTFTFQTPMRATATVTSYSPSTGASGKLKESTVGNDVTVAVNNGTWSGQIYVNNSSTVAGTNLTMHYTASAEL